VVIVTATRGDLRDEFCATGFAMADEAFALSPISARATLPGEADYDAISEAFMETSRGRWFLSEYAKRNRNADTRMVLDAVARIEQNLADQKSAAPENELADALAVFRTAVEEARIAASQAIGGLVLEESVAPIRIGAQVIRETLLKLREIGADGRIYDLMDSQVSAIEAGCGQLAAADARAALNAAFDLIEARIARLTGGDDDAKPAPVSEAVPFSSAAFGDATPAAVAEATSPSKAVSEAAMEITAASPPEPIVETDVAMADAETALDDALDMIALEMAAPDLAEDDADMFGAIAPEPAEPIIAARGAEAAIAPSQASAPEPSLGASLIENGIVRRPEASVADPLAPIRRMSQAEKIAFFS
jgi:hypothetical protein